MKRVILAGAFTALTALVIPTAAHADAILVGEDVAGDWDSSTASTPEAAPLGSPLGQDLIGASIEVTEDTAIFGIQLTELLPIGGTPELTRYSWNLDLKAGDTVLSSLDLDGKFTNVSRGTCDPTAGTCPPPRDPNTSLAAPFFLRGNCTTTDALPPPSPTPGTRLTLCEEFAVVTATFDVATASISIPIPLSALTEAAEQCSFEIAPGINNLQEADAFLSAAPSAFLTYGAFPMDFLGPIYGDDGVVTVPVDACAG